MWFHHFIRISKHKSLQFVEKPISGMLFDETQLYPGNLQTNPGLPSKFQEKQFPANTFTEKLIISNNCREFLPNTKENQFRSDFE